MPHIKISSNKQHAPKWLRQRAIGECQRGFPQVTSDTVRRIKLESTLEGHASCVNCLEWNARGDLLASGSDDQNVILWDPFRACKRSVIKTCHQGNIFSVNFVPNSNDTLLATCGSDGFVAVTNVVTGELVFCCRNCNQGRVKRLAVHPNQPHLLWSASEDGNIMQYDIREAHTCNPARPKALLIDLKTLDSPTHKLSSPGRSSMSAKCLAMNPMRDEMLAVGTNDIFVKLFDRRQMPHKSRDSCIAQFSPGHMLKSSTNKPRGRSIGATYVTFSPNGAELLANLHGEHIYLYNTYEPWEEYKSFDTIRPLLQTSDSCQQQQQLTTMNNNNYDDIDMIALTKEGQMPKQHCDIPEKYRVHYVNIAAKLTSNKKFNKTDIDILNEMLTTTKTIPELYLLRALALIDRDWIGDGYQAVRDCCCALALKPRDINAIRILRDANNRISDKSSLWGIDGHNRQGSVSDFDDKVFNEHAYDYKKRFCGHCNLNTDIKEATFFGYDGEFIVAGSDDGAFYIWDKVTTNLVKAVQGDMHILNCLQPHPNICMLATSGIEPAVKLWSPTGKTCHDVTTLEQRCAQNQDFISTDPMEAMIMMLYPTDLRGDD